MGHATARTAQRDDRVEERARAQNGPPPGLAPRQNSAPLDTYNNAEPANGTAHSHTSAQLAPVYVPTAMPPPGKLKLASSSTTTSSSAAPMAGAAHGDTPCGACFNYSVCVV